MLPLPPPPVVAQFPYFSFLACERNCAFSAHVAVDGPHTGQVSQFQVEHAFACATGRRAKGMRARGALEEGMKETARLRCGNRGIATGGDLTASEQLQTWAIQLLRGFSRPIRHDK